MGPFGGHMSTQNLLVLSTGGGIHQNPLQSNLLIEVDEFKFSKIFSFVAQKAAMPAKQDKETAAGDDSCSMSDEDYDSEDTQSESGVAKDGKNKIKNQKETKHGS